VLNVRFLEPKDEATFLEALGEIWEPGFTFAHHYEKGMSCSQYLKILETQRDGSGVASEHVPSTLLFAFVPGENGKDRCVGRVSIRHRLNDSLAVTGGHIGYGVRPSERRKGYATLILGQSLTIAKMIGIDRALVTCDGANLGSIRTIERNGGYLEGTVLDPKSGILKRRYWITV
jgi:predicted acetyltransferase